jgi:cation diffusion facilitator CzcD-associated flavoprotein CzcO
MTTTLSVSEKSQPRGVQPSTQAQTHGRQLRAVKDVVVIGAGPYGLSVTAHLLHAGAQPYVLGKPMSFWKDNMPGGMLLRSRVEASDISAPQKNISIDAFQKATRRKLPLLVPIEDFIAYGEWVQKQVAPDLDQRKVVRVSQDGSEFLLTLEDGETIRARSVVLALGIGPFAYRPEPFANVPREFAPHSSELNDFSKFRGKRVAVFGKGQSAMEYAALLHDCGANVFIVTRAPKLVYRPLAWRKHMFRVFTPGPLRRIGYKILPPTDLGDISTARKMANPELFRQQPPEVQEKLLKDCAKPIGSYWLEPRLESVRVKAQANITAARVADGHLQMEFADGSTEQADAALLATGYKIDISRYQILDRELVAKIRTDHGYPVLDTQLQTSVSGLFMAGVVGEKTLGPTLRFVTGTSNAGPRLAAGVVKRNKVR